MPKPTFFNLPDDKRERIVDLAIEEFAGRTYAQASLSRIVARAGIAKGSIYQYFDDKLDLYRWLLREEVPRRKVAAMRERTDDVDPSDLVGLLRASMLSGFRFMLSNPRLAQMASAVTMPTDDPELRTLYAEVRAEGLRAFEAMLAPARERGDLRDDVDLAAVARVLSVVLTHGVQELAALRFGVDLFALDPGATPHIDDIQLRAAVDELLALVLHGIEPR